MDENYSVSIEGFAERHYIKQFQKKYHRAWDVTLTAITRQFEHIDRLTETNTAEIIVSTDSIKIIKTEFKIAGTNESAKSSGNRVIIAVSEKDKAVYVLLVYTKTDVKGSRETDWWQNIIRENYPQYKNFF